MKNPFLTHIYNVYYRNRNDSLLFDDNSPLNGFKKLKNPFGKWAADPFVINYKGITYVFAEMAGIASRKGDIYCLNLASEKKKWKKCISSNFHMSFPNIFAIGDDFYMVPETAHDCSVTIYQAQKMPTKWLKNKVLYVDEQSIHPVDNVPLPFDSGPFQNAFLSYIRKDNHNFLALFKKENDAFSLKLSIGDEESKLRPAGNIFTYKNKYYFPSQDCSKTYGGGLIINELVDSSSFKFSRQSFEIFPKDVVKSGLEKRCVGIHTYNSNQDFEVIDIISRRFSLIAFFGKINRLFRRLLKSSKN
jgi:hypothetical protein